MSILTSDPTTPVNDQKLREVARAVLHTVTMSAEKAALNHADPKRFPVKPGVNSIENTIAPLFKELPPERQAAVKTQALASLAAPSAQRAAAAGAAAAAVDFTSPVPVSDQVHANAARVKTQLARAPKVIGEDDDWPRVGDGDRWPPKDGGNGDNGGGTLPLKRAVLTLHSIKAVKETKDWGKDEIYLGATAVGITTVGGKPVTSKEMVVDAFSLGSFKKGQTKLLRDRVLYAFYPPKPPEQYPAGYAVTLLLLEKDWGKRETIRKVLKNIEDAVAKEIAKWAKEFDGLVGKLAELVMKLLPPLLAKIFDLIAGWLGDDLFDPATITLSITSPASRVPGSNFTPRQVVPLLMKGGKNGRYELTYSWHVFA